MSSTKILHANEVLLKSPKNKPDKVKRKRRALGMGLLHEENANKKIKQNSQGPRHHKLPWNEGMDDAEIICACSLSAPAGGVLSAVNIPSN